MHPNVQRVVAAAGDLGLTIEVRTFPEGTKTAADAAAAIGVEVGQIVKSLVFAVDGDVVMALVSGANQLDERKLAAAAGGAKSGRVDADAVREATGFPIGGVLRSATTPRCGCSSIRTCSGGTRCGPRPARGTTSSASRPPSSSAPPAARWSTSGEVDNSRDAVLERVHAAC